MQRTLSEAGGRNEALSGEIASAVQTMQFQDGVSQRIGHIVEALESMQAAISGPLDPASPASAPNPKAASVLSGSYTMDSERAVHAAIVGGTSVEGELNDVEIF